MRHCIRIPIALALAAFIAGCAGTAPTPQTPRPSSSGYYGGDLPPQSMEVDPDSVADAVVRAEALSATGNRPYTALGKRYHPIARADARGHVERGVASWYGRKFHGRRTSSGERYDMFAMTAAHPTLPLPSYARVTNLDNGKSVVVKVNDRGPFLHNRILDLSYIAAHKLGIAQRGTGRVEVRVLTPDDAAPVAESTAETIDESSASDDKVILIQVGAYAERDNARAMRRLLDDAGYPLLPMARTDAALYRVRVGPYASRTEAADQRRKLESLLGHAVVVVVE